MRARDYFWFAIFLLVLLVPVILRVHGTPPPSVPKPHLHEDIQ
jgi:hypothetical protein